MKTSRLERIALFGLLGMFMILYSCQKDETSIENQTQIVNSKGSSKGKKQKSMFVIITTLLI